MHPDDVEQICIWAFSNKSSMQLMVEGSGLHIICLCLCFHAQYVGPQDYLRLWPVARCPHSPCPIGQWSRWPGRGCGDIITLVRGHYQHCHDWITHHCHTWHPWSWLWSSQAEVLYQILWKSAPHIQSVLDFCTGHLQITAKLEIFKLRWNKLTIRFSSVP